MSDSIHIKVTLVKDYKEITYEKKLVCNSESNIEDLSFQLGLAAAALKNELNGLCKDVGKDVIEGFREGFE